MDQTDIKTDCENPLNEDPWFCETCHTRLGLSRNICEECGIISDVEPVKKSKSKYIDLVYEAEKQCPYLTGEEAELLLQDHDEDELDVLNKVIKAKEQMTDNEPGKESEWLQEQTNIEIDEGYVTDDSTCSVEEEDEEDKCGLHIELIRELLDDRTNLNLSNEEFIDPENLDEKQDVEKVEKIYQHLENVTEVQEKKINQVNWLAKMETDLFMTYFEAFYEDDKKFEQKTKKYDPFKFEIPKVSDMSCKDRKNKKIELFSKPFDILDYGYIIRYILETLVFDDYNREEVEGFWDKMYDYALTLREINKKFVEIHPKFKKIELEYRSLSEICAEQSSTDLCLPTQIFSSLVQEIGSNLKNNIVFELEAIEVLQEASEAFLINYFKLSNKLAIHAGRDEVIIDDCSFSKSLLGFGLFPDILR
jgi:histone H3/H4